MVRLIRNLRQIRMASAACLRACVPACLRACVPACLRVERMLAAVRSRRGAQPTQQMIVLFSGGGD